MTPTPTRPMPDLPPLEAPSLLVINGKTFVVKEVPEMPMQRGLDELQEWYRDSLEEAKAQIGDYVSAEQLADLDAQVTRIQRFQTQGAVVVPTELVGEFQPIMVRNGRALPARVIRYKPDTAKVHLHSLKDYATMWKNAGAATLKKHSKFIAAVDALPMWTNEAERVAKFVVKFDQDLLILPTLAALDAPNNRIWVTNQSYIFHAYTEGKLCTGNSTAQDFWNAPDFERNFQRLNPYSFANSGALGNFISTGDRWEKFLENAYFLELRRETSAWNA